MTGKLRATTRVLLVCCYGSCAITAFSQDVAPQPVSDQLTVFRKTMLQQNAAAAPPPGQSLKDIIRQVREISGLVTDSTGPLPGVSVSLKGKNNVGTTTDQNGRYILSVPDDNAIIVFSMVGYEDQQFPVKGKITLDVAMKRANAALDDVVVVAYGKQKRKEVVGSVTSISPGELKIPSSNLTTALAGRLAGVIGYQRSGEPGRDNAEFFIRGVTTFGYKKDPLILIDNVEYTTDDLARLQPDDIAAFSIMKDATATALYGARGANGVILVTTKEGKQGKVRFNFRVENTWSSPTQDVKFADPVTYMKLENEANATRGNLILPYSQEKIENTESGKNPVVFPAVNWRDMLFKNTTTNQRVNFSLSGGGPVATYFVSGAVNIDNGIMKVDKRNNFNNNIDLKTYILRSNIVLNLTPTTQGTVRVNGQFTEYKGPIDGGKDLYMKSMRANPVLFPAYYPVDDSHRNTNHIMFGNAGEAGFFLNPYADMVKGYKDQSQSLMLAQLELRQDLRAITPGLTLNALMNTNRRAEFSVSRQYRPFFYAVGSYDRMNNSYSLLNLNPNTGTDFLDYQDQPNSKKVVSIFNFQSQLNYTRLFNDKHQVSGLLVFQALHQQEGTANSLQTSLPSRNLTFSGRATYGYDNKYFAEVNFGYNGSERFYKTERFGFFPSAGVGWYVSNEPWFDKLKLPVSKLKFRGTYGLVGNDAIGNKDDRFFYLSDMNMNNGNSGAVFGTDGGYVRPGVTIARYDNKNITWETAAKSNVAVELGLWNKMEIIAEAFWEHRYNILMDRTISSTIGLQGQPPKANVGKARSKGVDISLDYTERVGADFTVNVRGNFTYATSWYDHFEEPQYDEAYLSHKGKPIRQMRGYIAERLFIDDEEVRSSASQTFGGEGRTRGGDIKFRDVNGDGQITVLDQVFIGYPTTPEITYGFGFAAQYKGLDFSAFFQGNARTSFWIDVESTAPFVRWAQINGVQFNTGMGQTQLLDAYAKNHWSEDNRNPYALWPRLDPTLNANNQQVSTWFMRNGAFMRLETVEIGYTFPRKLVNRWKMGNLRIYVNANDVISFSRFKMWDPEMGGDGLDYPIQRKINIGLNISF
ncbi:MAG TPA: TonB-dependent receptor [Pseudobacter sp.]|nr:TonB-dependent receptor [Pseudobacter sp.]